LFRYLWTIKWNTDGFGIDYMQHTYTSRIITTTHCHLLLIDDVLRLYGLRTTNTNISRDIITDLVEPLWCWHSLQMHLINNTWYILECTRNHNIGTNSINGSASYICCNTKLGITISMGQCNWSINKEYWHLLAISQWHTTSRREITLQ